MLKQLMKPEIQELIERKNLNDLKDVLSTWPAPEIADLLLDIDKSSRAIIFRTLPRDLAAKVFSYLETDQRNALLYDLTDQETRQLLADIPPDDRTALFEELPAKVTMTLMNLLSPSDLKEARELLGYPEDSIGRLMTPDFVAVRPEWTVSQALKHIRIFGKDSETINRIYVTDKDGNLLDDVLLRNIILAEENQKISSLMDNNFVSVSAFDDQEVAVKIMEKYDIAALPVVDSQGKLVGIVTFDDIMDISKEEATEDFQKISGMTPFEETYQSVSVFKLWTKRLPWLAVLLFANSITTAVISSYQNAIESVIALTFFIPMLIGTGGNTGTQSSTLIIRSLAVGDITIKHWFKVFMKEIIIGILLGIALGLFAFIRGLVELHSGLEIPITIGVSMIAIVIWANIIGAMLPLIIAKLKLDPAVISSPFIATFTDITGMIIYFNIALMILKL